MKKYLLIIFLLSCEWSFAQYCVPTVTGASGNNLMQNFSLAGYGGTSINDYGPVAIPANGYEDRTTAVDTINLQQGTGYEGHVTQSGPFTHGQVWIDFNDDDIFEPSESVSAVFGYTGNQAATIYYFTVTVPFTAPLGIHRMRVRFLFNNLNWSSASLDPCSSVNDNVGDTSTNANGTTRDYDVNIVAPPACTGMPIAGTAFSSTGYACAGTSVTLTDTGFTFATLFLQWQSSADSANWTNIPGATSDRYTFTGQNATTYYRMQATCSGNSTFSTVSNGVKIYEAPCYCMPVIEHPGPDQQGMRVFNVTGYNGSSIHDAGPVYITDTNVLNRILYNNQIYHYQDDYYYQPVYGYEDRTAAFAPLVLQQGNNYNYSGSITGPPWLELYYAGNHSLVSVVARIWIDFNDNGTFDSSEAVTGVFGYSGNLYDTAYTFTMAIPLNATPGSHRMRVRSTFILPILGANESIASLDPCIDSEMNNGTELYNSGGITRDYEVSIIAAPPACTGAPSPGTAFANTQYACGLTNVMLNDTGFSSVAGLSLQWQSSADSVHWSSIPGATTAPYTVINQDTTTYYRCLVKCNNTGDSSYSNAALVYFGGCYCIPTFWLLNANGAGTLSDPANVYEMLNFSLTGLGGTGINDNGPTPADPAGYEDRSMTVAAPDLQQGSSYAGSISENTSDSMYNQVWIDFNDDGTFDSSEAVTSAFGYSGATVFNYTMAIPANAATGHHKMRVRSVYGEGAYYYDSSTSPITGILYILRTDNLASGLSTCNNFPEGTDYSSFGIIYQYGMTRDYEVNIVGTSCDTVTGITLAYTTLTTAELFWDPVPTANLYDYVIDQSAGVPSGTGTATTATAVFAIGLQQATTYYAHVRVNCGPGMYSPWATIPFTTCDTLSNVSVSDIQTTSATVSWSATGANPIYILDEQDTANPAGAGTPVSANSVSLEGLSCHTTYYFHIRNTCSGDTSLWQTIPFTTANCPGPNGVANVNSNDAFSISVYPNPVKGIVSVSIAGMTTNAAITIDNVVGQNMEMINIGGSNKIAINMNDYAPGIYFIKYTDDVHTQVIKIIKQ